LLKQRLAELVVWVQVASQIDEAGAEVAVVAAALALEAAELGMMSSVGDTASVEAGVEKEGNSECLHNLEDCTVAEVAAEEAAAEEEHAGLAHSPPHRTFLDQPEDNQTALGGIQGRSFCS
jgi:hypothetical protein